MNRDSIELDGVTTHNLKSVDVRLPKGRFIVAAGVSGSGKSSLIMDTLFEHSKSLYLGALSSKSLDLGDGDYQFDRIAGTQPPVALRQRDGGSSNPRSTVGTLTGLDGLYRLLFGAGSRPVCPVCFGPTEADLLCPRDGCFAEPHTAKHFSANRREGKCLACDGLGELIDFSLEQIVPDPSKTLTEIWDGADPGTFAVPNVRKAFEAMSSDIGLDLDTPFKDLSPEQAERVLHGSDTVYTIKIRKVTNDVRFEGILGFMQRAYKNASTAARRTAFSRYLAKETCSACGGGRLRPESLTATVAGHSFDAFQSDELTDSIVRLRDALMSGTLPPQVRELASAIIKQSENIRDVGLGHLQLRRSVPTLSGGELQRLLLAQHLASDLTGVMYVLDEPTAGLHDSETGRIIASLRRLRDLGNTVIAIEHDESVIRSADWIVELGPGAGSRGGEVVVAGPFSKLLGTEGSPTAAALLAEPPVRRRVDIADAPWLEVRGISHNNVRDQTVRLPLGGLTCVSGVSGAGKSSLVAGLRAALSRAMARGGDEAVSGAETLTDVIHIGQRAIGRSSRSTLATYIGIGDAIRDAFAASSDAVERGLGRAEFSTNVPGGRCEACKGLGLAEVGTNLFSSESVVCPECDGRKFQDHVLEVRLDGRTVHDVLSMTVEDAAGWFAPKGNAKVVQALTVLTEFGLGYLQLGSATTTVSGGEAQRLNLAGELLKQRRSGTLFIFDEPTRGLHPADIRHLLALFDRLVSTGNTVIAIEHNLRVLAISDWVVDLGPGAGAEGGRVIHCGSPESLADNPDSATGRCLRARADGHDTVADTADAADTVEAVGPVAANGSRGLEALGELLPRVVAVIAGTKQHPEGNGSVPYGLAIGSLTVVSGELGLVGFVVAAQSSSWAAIADGGRFCVNVLADDQAGLGIRFSRTRPDRRFTELSWRPSASGSPHLAGAYAVLECHLEGTYRMGDHDLVVAKCLSVDVDPEAGSGPLLRADEAGTVHHDYGWQSTHDDDPEVR